MSKILIIHADIWGWKVYKHSTGNLRFSIYDGEKEICWCRTEERAKQVVLALRKAEFS